MNTCPHCGQEITAAIVVERIINRVERSQAVSEIRYKCQSTLTEKQVANALAYLVRHKKVVRTRYGEYQPLEKK